MEQTEKRLKMPIWVVVAGLVISSLVLGVSAGSLQTKAQEVDENQVVEGVEADQEGSEAEVLDKRESFDEAQDKPVDYYLPYPGVLPDHPLYWLKMIRDRVQLWLTAGDLARAERLLLYADKRLGASWALIEGNKVDLGVTTITKAEKYLEQALRLGGKLGETGEEERFREKLYKAATKHEEIVEQIKAKLDDGHQETLEQMLIINRQGRESFSVKEQEVKQGMVEVMVKVDFGDRQIESEIEAASALEALLSGGVLEQGMEVMAKEYEFGTLVESIGDYSNSNEKAWIYFVNDQAGEVAADKHQLQAGDVVEWRFE